MSAEFARPIQITDYTKRAPETSYKDREQVRHLHPVMAEKREGVGIPPLAYEVDKIRQDPQKERLYLLPDTGFHVDMQANLLLDNLRFGVPIENSFKQLDQDINAFKIEYLVEGPVFPIVLDRVQRNGETRIAGKLYGEKLWLDATDGKERDGVVKKSVAEMEDFLVTAKPGSTVVMASPDGWSGYYGIKYPESQLYVITVSEDKSLKGFTFKTHMNLSQNEALLVEYGAFDKNVPRQIDARNRIKNVVGTVVKFLPEEGKNLEGIVNDIKHIMGTDVAYTDTTGKERTFSEMEQILKNPEPLWTLDNTTKKLVDNLKEYISYRVKSPDVRLKRDIEVAIGSTVLNLMHAVRPSVREGNMSRGTLYEVSKIIPIQPVFNAQEALEEMQKIGGCAGGGNTQVDSITPRAGVFGAEDQYGSLEFECPDCHTVNRREMGKLISQCQNEMCKSTRVACEDSTVTSLDKEKEQSQHSQEEAA